ncbi:hypothetical protein [Desulfolutivibrio sp.]|uniref:hypothetical protein n=1 Tax=Desulfolutivibrio sp. TaxID=2773296 RepID=UPI002F96C949
MIQKIMFFTAISWLSISFYTILPGEPVVRGSPLVRHDDHGSFDVLETCSFENYPMVKRIADWLEKFSVGAMLIGLFQNRPIGVGISLALLAMSLFLTRRAK